ncbi:hypothetical protein FBU30_008132 [Linnemannia zychae]|nr:hypothetical protein FBU30_008132 [Linnemannia zychae]
MTAAITPKTLLKVTHTTRLPDIHQSCIQTTGDASLSTDYDNNKINSDNDNNNNSNNTTVIAIDSLTITPSSTSKRRKVPKRDTQQGPTLTFSLKSEASHNPTLPATTTTTTATATIGLVTTASISPATKNAANTGRPAKTGRHNRGERMTFELDDVLREYTPDQFKTCKAYDVGGVNILNKKPVDSKTALDKIKRRRETHNRVERRRRDCINQLIDELTALLPKDDDNDISKSHRVNILRTAIAHIQNLTRQNENLQQQVDALKAGRPMPPPAIITTLAPTMDYDDSETVYSDNLPSPASASYTTYSPRSPLSPAVSTRGGSHSPISSPGGPLSSYRPLNPPSTLGRTHQEWTQPSRQLSPPSGGVPSSSYPSKVTASAEETISDIPMIVEPSEQVLTPESGISTVGSKRLNRQTLPRLQLEPPPFHHHNQHQHSAQHQYQHQHYGYHQQQHYRDHDQYHHRRRRSSSGSGFPQSPSYYSTDATSPNSVYSEYSSSSGPWSTSPGGPFSSRVGSISGGPHSGMSSLFGTSPRSPQFPNYGPPSPYSPYGPSSAHAQMSPSPGLAPWNTVISSTSTAPHSPGVAPQERLSPPHH